jgi:hypothetical protein
MLSTAGRELLVVVRLLWRWLKENPNRPLGMGDLFGVVETKALAIGWNSTVFHWLAERPCSLTELNAQSPPDVSYHELRKAREALSGTGLIAAVPSGDRGQPYELTEWMRGAARILAAAVRWERDFLGGDDSEPPSLELETLLRLFMLSSAPPAPAPDGEQRLGSLGSPSVTVMNDYAAICTPGRSDTQESQISGSLASWLDALVDGQATGLQMKGGIRLTTSLLDGLPRKAHP